MADNVQMGTLKPSYMGQAANLDSNSKLNSFMERKSMAKAMHPSNMGKSGRRQQFIDSANMHMGNQSNNAAQASTIKATPSGSMPSGMSANFSYNADMN